MIANAEPPKDVKEPHQDKDKVNKASPGIQVSGGGGEIQAKGSSSGQAGLHQFKDSSQATADMGAKGLGGATGTCR